MSGDSLRALVVEDSPTVRARITEALAAAPGIEVVGEARDGKEATALCGSLRPDVVTMDMMLPVMTGLSATEYIMAHFPTPILIVSSSTNRGELFKTYEALAAGAVDVLEKPTGEEPEGEWEVRLVRAVRMVARIRVITHLRARLAGWDADTTPPPIPAPPARPPSRARTEVVALGASTGGPSALIAVLRGLPRGFRPPVLVVLHLGAPFAASFAEWLDDQCPQPVVSARDGDPVAGLTGRVAMAPPGGHLIVRGGRLRVVDGPERHSCRPSVDVLFESMARDLGAGAAACLLTGIGRDGAKGLLDIRNAGGCTIAQDEASSIVYGMPREAALLGAAEMILPLDRIGTAIGALDDARGRGGA